MCRDAVVVVEVDRGAVENELGQDGRGVGDEKLAGGLHSCTRATVLMKSGYSL